jgi:hypothetical protein
MKNSILFLNDFCRIIIFKIKNKLPLQHGIKDLSNYKLT